ncbi:unnamed protein product [Cuscuta campestris]|uniref:Secreted protein n=1 Tax=Cuscuta campestris TaxID=132261 RepID=A0A484NNE0_9ASTE|nr:unnamed protein product [Cuscuta campestris]
MAFRYRSRSLHGLLWRLLAAHHVSRLQGNKGSLQTRPQFPYQQQITSHPLLLQLQLHQVVAHQHLGMPSS